MVLEATMVCVDNSEWMRNGDLQPTRFEAQAEAINLLAGQKTNENPENTVGILTLAGKGPRVLVTPTSDLGKILGAMHDLGMEGETNICSGVQVAQLALKHRQNKNQRQRIVLFTGSPVGADQAAMVKIGKKLKKNNVAVDVVCFGDLDEENMAKLEAFLGAVNSNDNSHLLTVPLGAALADCLLTSAICMGEDGQPSAAAVAAAGTGGGNDFEFGVDPNLDPELALALRVSMEEERARQEAAAKKAAEEGGDAAPTASGAADAQPEPAAAAVAGPEVAMDDDALLQQALALSMQEEAAATPATDAVMAGAVEEGDEAMALAIQMSLGMDQMQTEAEPKAEGDMTSVLGDADFVNSVLATLPGVDPNDPSVREMLASLGNQTEGTDGEKKDEETK
mmetsp:Transcript_32315/g.62124  ORF Transcript_32315/g.62124 Transcript_32315/m.62124 type:complete len:395 (+) Transcript_32315:215-1399(+)